MAITTGKMTILENFKTVTLAIANAAQNAGRNPSDVTLVAVSKTYDAEHISPLLQVGHRIFGENRVQEAKQKWPALKTGYSGIELHLIGPLQSNKAADAIALFDVIQTLDRPKIAEAIAAEMKKQGKSVRLYVQVNTGHEPQKAGIAPEDLAEFLKYVRDSLKLNIEGLMCIPPATDSPAKHFAVLAGMAKTHGITKISMGMSSDYAEAIASGATHVRVGSAIFGARNYT